MDRTGRADAATNHRLSTAPPLAQARPEWANPVDEQPDARRLWRAPGRAFRAGSARLAFRTVRRALVVIANPKAGSFTHAMGTAAADALARSGHEVSVHDLYAEGFQPVLRADEALTSGSAADSAFTRGADPLVAEHRRRLADADILVVAHPNWWGKPPAMMAGWMDRVIVPGVAYRLETGDGEPQCLLRLSRLVVLNTSDTPAEREVSVFGDPLDAIWRRCVGAYLGGATVTRLVAGPLASSTDLDRAAWLAAAADLIADGDPPDDAG